jgi:MFS family permease
VGLVFIAASAAAMLLLLSASFPLALVAAALLGSALGAEADLMPYLLSRYFGLERFGELYGYAFSAYAIAGGTGPFVMGWLYDTVGSYRPAVLLFAGMTAAAAVLIARLPRYGRGTG